MIFFNTLTLLQHNCADAVLRIVRFDRFQYSSMTLAYLKSKIERLHELRTFNDEMMLYILAAAEITEIEKDLLGMLDEQMRTFDCNRRHPNSVILGLCLRRLSLVYRRGLSQNRFIERIYPESGCPSSIYSSIRPRMLISSPKRHLFPRARGQSQMHVRRLHFSLQQSLSEGRIAILRKLARGGPL